MRLEIPTIDELRKRARREMPKVWSCPVPMVQTGPTEEEIEAQAQKWLQLHQDVSMVAHQEREGRDLVLKWVEQLPDDEKVKAAKFLSSCGVEFDDAWYDD